MSSGEYWIVNAFPASRWDNDFRYAPTLPNYPICYVKNSSWKCILTFTVLERKSEYQAVLISSRGMLSYICKKNEVTVREISRYFLVLMVRAPRFRDSEMPSSDLIGIPKFQPQPQPKHHAMFIARPYLCSTRAFSIRGIVRYHYTSATMAQRDYAVSSIHPFHGTAMANDITGCRRSAQYPAVQFLHRRRDTEIWQGDEQASHTRND